MTETTQPAAAHWLNQQRLRVYPIIFFFVFLLITLVWLASAHNLVDREGKPLGADFLAYWVAARLALAHHAVDAYNLRLIFQAERLAIPASSRVFDWLYPPSFYLVVLPLGLMPYGIAFFVWMASTLAAYVAVFRRILTGRTALWCLAAFPGLWINLVQGQNGFLTSALAGAALLTLPRRPALAGIFFGLLTFKPHLAILFPIALLAICAWRALALAAATAVAFLAAGTAVLGPATLRAFLAGVPSARLFVETGQKPWAKMPTVFAAARILGAPVPAAYAAHIAVAIAATAAVVYVWRKSQAWPLRSAALLIGTLMVSPYLYDYDLASLAFVLAWLTIVGLRDGWLPAEREILVFAWLFPFFMAPIALNLHLQPGPFILAALLWLCIRRTNAKRPKPHEVVAARDKGVVAVVVT